MSSLYDTDFYAWTQAQADALDRRSVNELDWDNVLEEMASLGRRERRELRNHLVILLQHLLKWRFQPTRRGRSWVLTVKEQRREIAAILEENPSLQPQVEDVLAEAYAIATLRAARETRLAETVFPALAPFGFTQAMSEALTLPTEADDAPAP